MAKQRRGLGRGLNSLLGESLGEIEQKNEREEEESREEEQREQRERKERERERNESRAAYERPARVPVNATVSEQAAEEATIAERPAGYRVPTPEEARQIEAEQAAQRVVISEQVEAPKPYIEEDDHVTIKSVAVREPKVEQQKSEEEVPLSMVVPNPDQPRTNFNREEILELAQSIEREGLLQPILVRRAGDGYQIIAGERRWQACKQLGMERIPIRVKDVPDDKALELALIENIQRTDLNPIEEAYGYKRLMERKGMTQAEVAQAVSKGRSTIANALRLLDLPEDAQQLLFEEKITAGHARAILSVPTKEGRQKLTKKLQEEKLSVRDTERLARLFAGQAQNQGSASPKRAPLPASFKKAARGLRESLNTNVRIKQAKGKNKIEIEFKDEEDLQRLFNKIVEQ